MPTTHGSVVYKDNIVDYDSIDVGRLRAAGAVIVGKATASEFGLVAYTATKLHGVTRNPWNLERTPAGSSGGSAAAVSGGLVPAATASDGGGSIRIPAAYTGLVGMKGTFGRIPRGPRARNGPLTSNWGTVARSVRDAARWYDVTSGYDPRDPFSLPRIDGWEDATSARARSAGLRVAVLPDLGAAVLEREVERVVTDAADALVAETGMRRVEATFRVPEKTAALGDAGAPGLFNDLKQFWPDCRDDLTYEIRFAMEFMENYRIWHAASVDRFRVEMNEAMADIFEQVDIVLCATSPQEAFVAEGPMPSRVDGVKVGPQQQRRADDPGEHQRLSGDLHPRRPDEQRAARRPAGVRAAARRRAAARPGAGGGANAAVAAGRARRAHLAVLYHFSEEADISDLRAAASARASGSGTDGMGDRRLARADVLLPARVPARLLLAGNAHD